MQCKRCGCEIKQIINIATVDGGRKDECIHCVESMLICQDQTLKEMSQEATQRNRMVEGLEKEIRGHDCRMRTVIEKNEALESLCNIQKDTIAALKQTLELK
jgi:hypothetical protein